MALYDDRLQTHAIWATKSAAREAMEATRDKLADPEQMELHARIEAILNLLDGRLQVIDGQLTYFNALDNISSGLGQLAASLNQFNEAPGSRPVLDQAETQASGILPYLAQMPSASADDVENLREIGARYRSSMSGHIGRITTEFNELTERVSQLAAQVEQQESVVSSEVTRLTQVAASAEEAFDAAQTQRDQEFEERVTDALGPAVTASEQVVSKLRTDSEEALGELRERAGAAWDEISGIRQRAEQASNYLGINALAAGYHETAEREEARAFWTRLGAIAAFIGAILASGFAVFYHVANAFSLQGVLTKALLALPFLVLAGYLARESSRHAERAHFNRQRQRQLEALPAYVDGLDAEQRAALYEVLAPGFFAPVGSKQDKEGEQEIDPTAALMALLIAQLRKDANP